MTAVIFPAIALIWVVKMPILSSKRRSVNSTLLFNSFFFQIESLVLHYKDVLFGMSNDGSSSWLLVIGCIVELLPNEVVHSIVTVSDPKKVSGGDSSPRASLE